MELEHQHASSVPIPDDIAVQDQLDELELNLHSIVNGHHNTTYRGVKMLKNPFDYLLYQMIINEVKPDLIIEIGTHYGGDGKTTFTLPKLNIDPDNIGVKYIICVSGIYPTH